MLGTLNPADVLTKHVQADLLERRIEAIGMQCPGGRPATAPELNALETVLVSWTALLEEVEHDLATRARVQSRGVRFAPVVNFRAILACNRGRRCAGTAKEHIPAGGQPSERCNRRKSPDGSRGQCLRGMCRGGEPAIREM